MEMIETLITLAYLCAFELQAELDNKGQVIENHTRFAHRFRGQGVAMSKLETACFSGINIEEEKVKAMVIDFVAEINKTVCK